MADKIKVGGIMQSDGRALVRALSVPAGPEGAAGIMAGLVERGINLELVASSHDLDEAANYSLVIAQKDLEQALTVLEESKAQVGTRAVSYAPDVAVISLFGPHLREKPKVPGMMFAALAGAGISSLAIATSISSVSCVVEGPLLDHAVEALLTVFEAPFQVKKRPKEY